MPRAPHADFGDRRRRSGRLIARPSPSENPLDSAAPRGHRRSIFNKGYRLAGLAGGDHSQRTTMCVVTFATGFAEKTAGGAQSF
jgi:hypothetical protein